MSVEAGAEMVNSGGGGPPFPGTGASELTSLNCDMVVTLVVMGLRDVLPRVETAEAGLMWGINGKVIQ